MHRNIMVMLSFIGTTINAFYYVTIANVVDEYNRYLQPIVMLFGLSISIIILIQSSLYLDLEEELKKLKK